MQNNELLFEIQCMNFGRRTAALRELPNAAERVPSFGIPPAFRILEEVS